MIIDKATTCYVVAVLAACTAVVVVHDGYFSHRPSPATHPAQPETVRVGFSDIPASSESSEGMPEEPHPPTLAVFSLPDAAAAEETEGDEADVSSGSKQVVRPFRIVRDRQCRAHHCAAWTALDLDTGVKSGATVDLAPLNLAPAIASPARKGLVDLLITAESLPDSDQTGNMLHLRAIKLEGVAPHRLAFRPPLPPAHAAPRHVTAVAHASLPDWLAPNGF